MRSCAFVHSESSLIFKWPWKCDLDLPGLIDLPGLKDTMIGLSLSPTLYLTHFTTLLAWKHSELLSSKPLIDCHKTKYLHQISRQACLQLHCLFLRPQPCPRVQILWRCSKNVSDDDMPCAVIFPITHNFFVFHDSFKFKTMRITTSFTE